MIIPDIDFKAAAKGLALVSAVIGWAVIEILIWLVSWLIENISIVVTIS